MKCLHLFEICLELKNLMWILRLKLKFYKQQIFEKKPMRVFAIDIEICLLTKHWIRILSLIVGFWNEANIKRSQLMSLQLMDICFVIKDLIKMLCLNREYHTKWVLGKANRNCLQLIDKNLFAAQDSVRLLKWFMKFLQPRDFGKRQQPMFGVNGDLFVDKDLMKISICFQDSHIK